MWRITFVLFLAACAGSSSASPTSADPTAASDSIPTITPARTQSPSPATPAPTPAPTPALTLVLGPDMIAEVVTTDLLVRTAPGLAPDSIIFPGRLGPDDRLYLLDGPVAADGYEWYLGLPYQARTNEDENEGWVRFGWVAAADKTGEAWIVPVPPECPSESEAETLAELPPVLRLSCFRGQTITLQGDVTCPDLGPPIPTAEPDWLTWKGCHLNPHGAPPYDPFGGRDSGIWIHYPPDAERLTGQLIVTGQFDDPRAQQCRLWVPTEEGDLHTQDLTHREVQLQCRASFVVTSAQATPGP